MLARDPQDLRAAEVANMNLEKKLNAMKVEHVSEEEARLDDGAETSENPWLATQPAPVRQFVPSALR